MKFQDYESRLAWRTYAAAALSEGCSTDRAADIADRMLALEIERCDIICVTAHAE